MKEIYYSLSWYAAHLFDADFYNRFLDRKLKKREYIQLVDSAITHKEFMLMYRDFWQFKLKNLDRKQLYFLRQLKVSLQELVS